MFVKYKDSYDPYIKKIDLISKQIRIEREIFRIIEKLKAKHDGLEILKVYT